MWTPVTGLDGYAGPCDQVGSKVIGQIGVIKDGRFCPIGGKLQDDVGIPPEYLSMTEVQKLEKNNEVKLVSSSDRHGLLSVLVKKVGLKVSHDSETSSSCSFTFSETYTQQFSNVIDLITALKATPRFDAKKVQTHPSWIDYLCQGQPGSISNGLNLIVGCKWGKGKFNRSDANLTGNVATVRASAMKEVGGEVSLAGNDTAATGESFEGDGNIVVGISYCKFFRGFVTGTPNVKLHGQSSEVKVDTLVNIVEYWDDDESTEPREINYPIGSTSHVDVDESGEKSSVSPNDIMSSGIGAGAIAAVARSAT